MIINTLYTTGGKRNTLASDYLQMSHWIIN